MISSIFRSASACPASSTASVGSAPASPRQSIATYELETADVLKSAPLSRDRLREFVGFGPSASPGCANVSCASRGEQTLPGDQVGPSNAGALLVNAMNVDPAHEADFNAWYDQEHIKLLAAVPGCLCARRLPGDRPGQPQICRDLSSRVGRGDP
ncbi:MAG: hypothetical protein WDO24_05520 [Pseudomonadota bacterium]